MIITEFSSFIIVYLVVVNLYLIHNVNSDPHSVRVVLWLGVYELHSYIERHKNTGSTGSKTTERISSICGP